MRTYHEVVDEIYYKVDHLEPWERGTRKTAGMSELFRIHFTGKPHILSVKNLINVLLRTVKIFKQKSDSEFSFGAL